MRSKKLSRAIEEARLTRPVPKIGKHEAQSAIKQEAEDLDLQPHTVVVDPLENGTPSWTVPYEVATITRAPLTCEFHDPSAVGRLAEMALEVIAFEGPVHKTVVGNRVARRWNLQKVGNRMSDAMELAYAALSRSGKIKVSDGFCSLQDARAIEKVRRSVSGSADTVRNIDQISGEEIALGIRCILGEAISFEEEQLIVQVARALGYDRTGTSIRSRLSIVIERMLREREIVREGTYILLPA